MHRDEVAQLQWRNAKNETNGNTARVVKTHVASAVRSFWTTRVDRRAVPLPPLFPSKRLAPVFEPPNVEIFSFLMAIALVVAGCLCVVPGRYVARDLPLALRTSPRASPILATAIRRAEGMESVAGSRRSSRIYTLRARSQWQRLDVWITATTGIPYFTPLGRVALLHAAVGVIGAGCRSSSPPPTWRVRASQPRYECR